MEIFNIGPMELILIVLLMFILLGPTEMIRLTRQAGVLFRKASQSSLWKELKKFSNEVQELPTRLVREAGFEEQMEEIRQSTRIPSPQTGLDREAPDTPGAAKHNTAYHRYRPQRLAARPPFEKPAQDTPPSTTTGTTPPNPPADQNDRTETTER